MIYVIDGRVIIIRVLLVVGMIHTCRIVPLPALPLSDHKRVAHPCCTLQ